MDRVAEVVALLLLPVFTAEVLTGSTRLWELVNPVALASLVGLYGLGALVVREVRYRLGLGFAGVFVLGMAYGVVEEGVAVKSFFDPGWPDLGVFAEYGRWAGVNLVWAVYLTLFHAVSSIAAPIALVEALYPRLRGERLTTDKTLALVAVLFVIDVLVLNRALTDYEPGPTHYVGALLAASALALLATRLKSREGSGGTAPRLYGVCWAGWATAFFLAFYAIPAVTQYTMASFMAAAALTAAALWLIKAVDASPQHMHYLYVGSATPLLAITALQSLRPDAERAVALLLGLTILVITYKKVKTQRTGDAAIPGTLPGI